MTVAARLSEIDFSGLTPLSVLCIGRTYSREDVKGLLLAQGRSLGDRAVLRVDDLCAWIIGGDCAVLGPLARQEGLRLLLSNPSVLKYTPELKRLRRQSGFYRKLDRAVQAGRMAFASGAESEALSAYLEERLGKNPIRDEIKNLLTSGWEAWLEAVGGWDTPRLLAEATKRLEEFGLRDDDWPEEIVHLAAEEVEAREMLFWQTLGHRIAVRRLDPVVRRDDEVLPARWERWHTLDDAAESVAERLEVEGWKGRVILIPDHPHVRRSIRRALAARKIPLADPRNPVKLRESEGIKRALLPLRVVARAYEREMVVAWISMEGPARGWPHADWVDEIQKRGVRLGLGAYAGGKLAPLSEELLKIERAYGGRRTVRDLGRSLVGWLREHDDPQADYFESFWETFSSDMERVGQGERSAPPLYWHDRASARIDEATPPVERLRPEEGVTLHRLGQFPLTDGVEELTIFGLPPEWLSGEGTGDYWFSERERELLSTEFDVRSAFDVRRERITSLREWTGLAKSIRVVGANYGWDGREQPSVLPILRDLGLAPNPNEPVECGAHSRWLASFNAQRSVPPQTMQLKSLAELGKNEIDASTLDHYSVCGFIGLARSRWKLYDVREASPDLWSEVRGTLLHAAAVKLLEARSPEGVFSRTPEDVLEEVWSARPQRGLIRGPRIERSIRQGLLKILRIFCEKEQEYVVRARTRIEVLEGVRDINLRQEIAGYTVVGRPDRIDANEEGLFVIDFKTQSRLASGKDMIERGLRLQLPFYAIAASRQLGRPALGLQFIHLGTSGARNQGVFFAANNGKEEGRLTKTTANSNSLIRTPPNDAWAALEAHLESHVRGYAEGRFAAAPKDLKECGKCGTRDLCGYRRLSRSENEAGEGGGDGD